MIQSARLVGFAAAVAGAVAVVAGAPVAQAEFPERPVTLIVPWSAGGGTDATARIIASLLEDELGQPVNVVNRTGGSGVVGHQAIADAEPDGYTIGMATVEIGMMHWQGLTELTYEAYEPIALVNVDNAGIHVAADSDYADLNALVEAIRAGGLQASGTGQGGIWHLALAGMLQSLDIDPGTVAWIPSEGAAPALQDLVAGGVDFVASSLPEARTLVEAERVRSIALMAAEPDPAFPDVQTVVDATGTDWAMGTWRGIVAPAGTPPEATAVILEALRTVHEADAFREFMANRGFGVGWLETEEFSAFMAQSDTELGAVMEAVGLAAQ